MRRLAHIDVPVDAGEFQLIDRQVVKTLRGFEDYYPYIRGMIASCGFRRVGVPYVWKARQRGYSKARFYHLIDQALNAIISLSNVPMRLCMFFGVGVAVLSMLYGVFGFIMNLIYYRQLAEPGVPTLIIAVFFFSGLQLFFFGVLGEYISAIHFQVRKRPLVIERRAHQFRRRCPVQARRRIVRAGAARPADLSRAKVTYVGLLALVVVGRRPVARELESGAPAG